MVYETRELLCELFAFPEPDYVVFTKNITESLNLIIKGLFQANDHVITTSMEHNAVIRPLKHLEAKYNGSLAISIIPCDKKGALPLGSRLDSILHQFLRPNTKAIIMTHASNVCGTILPLEEIGAFCQRHSLYFLIDAAQTAGVEKIDFGRLRADALAFTGHKGLLGPQGIGGLLLSPRLASQIEPLITGGTGSSSEEEYQPVFMPDRFEAGTPNIPGIYGLNAALKYLKKIGINTIQQTETLLLEKFYGQFLNFPGVNNIGYSSAAGRTAVISLDFPGLDNALVSHRLSSVFGITNRCGLHCSPLAHKTLGTFPQGTVRFSLSHFHTPEDIDYLLEAIWDCVRDLSSK
jgi:cysteine desulfurase family protein